MPSRTHSTSGTQPPQLVGSRAAAGTIGISGGMWKKQPMSCVIDHPTPDSSGTWWNEKYGTSRSSDGNEQVQCVEYWTDNSLTMTLYAEGSLDQRAGKSAPIGQDVGIDQLPTIAYRTLSLGGPIPSSGASIELFEAQNLPPLDKGYAWYFLMAAFTVESVPSSTCEISLKPTTR